MHVNGCAMPLSNDIVFIFNSLVSFDQETQMALDFLNNTNHHKILFGKRCLMQLHYDFTRYKGKCDEVK